MFFYKKLVNIYALQAIVLCCFSTTQLDPCGVKAVIDNEIPNKCEAYIPVKLFTKLFTKQVADRIWFMGYNLLTTDIKYY